MLATDTACQSIVAALYARDSGSATGGTGQHLRLSMLDATVSFLWHEAMAGYTWVGDETERARPQLAQDLVFKTTDGFMTAGTVADAEWEGFCRAAGHPAWEHDARFATTGARVIHVEERLSRMQEVLSSATTAEWLERLDAEGVPCAPILSRAELLTHPQLLANGLVVEGTHPHAGPMRQARHAARFDATPAALRLPAPLLGEHTEDVLRELGIDEDALAALRRDGILG